VFGAKVKIDNTENIFNAGMAAEVIITAAEAPTSLKK
jgi:hypothetical protein